MESCEDIITVGESNTDDEEECKPVDASHDTKDYVLGVLETFYMGVTMHGLDNQFNWMDVALWAQGAGYTVSWEMFQTNL